jgi:hypothetical protein
MRSPCSIALARSEILNFSAKNLRNAVFALGDLVPWLNQQRRKTAQEGWRNAALQLFAGIAGIATAWLSSAAIPKPQAFGMTGLERYFWSVGVRRFRILKFDPDIRDKGQRPEGSRS